MAGGDGLGQSPSGDHPHERRFPSGRGGCRGQGPWRGQSLCRGQFCVSHLWFVQSHLESGGPDPAVGRPAEKGDGMTRRGVLAGLMAVTVAAAGGAVWKFYPFRKQYPPTPYDDLLNQIADREPAIVFGQTARKSLPGAAQLAAQLRRDSRKLAVRAAAEPGEAQVTEVAGW